MRNGEMFRTSRYVTCGIHMRHKYKRNGENPRENFQEAPQNQMIF